MKLGLIDVAVQIFRLMHVPDQCSWTSVVSGFAQHDPFEKALEYFTRLHREDFVPNDYSFGNALSACVGLRELKMQNGLASEALEVFVLMMECGFKPDELTLVSMVNACANLSTIKEGQQIHACVVKCAKYRDNLVLGNALVDMYAKE
ncbi:unnamed protein product [Malus baccata var. baccata]